MKKAILAGLLCVSSMALARGGGGEHGGLPLNSMAYLVHEATENSMRLLLSSDPSAAALVSGVDANVLDAQATTQVTIELGSERVAKYLCTPVDDFSHGGTIVKKEMLCRPN